MSEAKTLLDAGDLTAAIEAATSDVRARPADQSARLFLFELLLFAGEWERALKQLDAVATHDTQSELGAQVYRNNITALRARERLWAEGVEPHFLTEPPPDIDQQLTALNEVRAGRAAQARKLLKSAAAKRPELTGQFNGQPFTGWRDADDIVAPVLELIISDKYTWLPFAQIKRIELAPPRRLRDLVWCSARVETRQGAIGEMFVPTLYEGSSRHADDRVKLGRMTDWQGDDKGPARGVGLRLFVAGADEQPIFAAQQVEFD